MPNAYDGLRSMALGMTAAKLGLDPASIGGAPFGIIMDMGFPTATVTLVCFITGECSMYVSSGGGVIGAGGHAAVKHAAIAFVRSAADALTSMNATTHTPRPHKDATTFYVLASTGIFTATHNTDDLGNGKTALSSLFFRGQDVITQIRLMPQPKRS